jgi:RNA polymerase sigma-70 factor (ECF subfamily)
VIDAERDEQLVRRFLEGDVAAFTSLVRRHEARIYHLCLRILSDPDDAADAAQDAFLTALRKLDQFRGEAAFTTWMHRVAVNACYDILRKRKRTPMLRVVDEDDAEAGPPHPDHADRVAGSADAAAALAAIPEEFRVALVLADVQDLAYDEIARILDVPVGTVKSRVHRGRVALARVLGLQGGEPRPASRASEETS